MKKLLVPAACSVVLAGLGLLIPVGGYSVAEHPARAAAENSSFTGVSAEPPRAPLDLLFIHHSVGGHWLADPGPPQQTDGSLWQTHPEGGGLRAQLSAQGYRVHEASYGSAVGERTDDPDWLPKFRDQMEQVLATAANDRKLPEGQRNRVVVFKSCFPNNSLKDEAAFEQVRAQYAALLPIFARHPDVLFVRVTTPPLAGKLAAEPLWKALARRILGKPQPAELLRRSGPLARKLDEWAVSPDGWLEGYPHKNVAVFDLYGILTDGKSDFLAFPTGGGYDSHPSRVGNERATAGLVPFLNRAVRRAGLAD